MAPAKCAPSNSCVPPTKGAVGVTLKDRGGGGSGGGGGGCGGGGGAFYYVRSHLPSKDGICAHTLDVIIKSRSIIGSNYQLIKLENVSLIAANSKK